MRYKYLLFAIFIFTISNISFSQKQFPIQTPLRDINNKKIPTNVLAYNIDKPIIVVIWASFIESDIDLLNSFKAIYPEWQKAYGVKIVAISMEKKFHRKKALKLIKDNNWPFNFYFDYDQSYFVKSSRSRAVPQVLIYDKNYHLIERFNHTISNYNFDNQDVVNMPKKVKKENLTNKHSNLNCDLTPYEEVLESIK